MTRYEYVSDRALDVLMAVYFVLGVGIGVVVGWAVFS